MSAEAGLTLRLAPRWSARFFGGVGTFLNRRCCLTYYGAPEPPREWADHPLVPHAGVSLNVALASLGGASDDWAPPRRSWYGWQLIALDLATAAVWASPLSGDWNGYAWIGNFTAAPVVHSLAGRPGRAVISGLLRVGLPFLGAIAGMGIDRPPDDSEDSDPFAGALEGALAAWVATVIFGDVWLARGTPTR